MKTKKQAIEVIKSEIESYKDAKLSLEALDVAGWKGKLNSEGWKKIGYISALSWAFDVKPIDLEDVK